VINKRKLDFPDIFHESEGGFVLVDFGVENGDVGAVLADVCWDLAVYNCAPKVSIHTGIEISLNDVAFVCLTHHKL
jgi:hypothetical protein